MGTKEDEEEKEGSDHAPELRTCAYALVLSLHPTLQLCMRDVTFGRHVSLRQSQPA